MSRLTVNDVELRYPSNGGDKVPYFSIKGDRETKQIRLLYNTINDVFFDVVHNVEINQKYQSIACLNSDGTHSDQCPMCSANFNQSVKLYIPVLDLSDNKVKIWTRSKSFVAQIQAIAARNNPISGVVLEVMRIGAPRDPKTQYILTPIAANDGNTVESLGVTVPDASSLMRNMDFAQMQNFVSSIDGSSPSYMPQPNAYAPQNTYQAPPQNTFYGSEPVRRNAPSSVPAYTTPSSIPMSTTPMQGVPNIAPVTQAVPNPQVSQPVNYATTPIADDSDLPF